MKKRTNKLTPITDEEAEALADWVEHSKLSDWGPPRPGTYAWNRGRPSLIGGPGASPRRGIRLPQLLDDLYRAKAKSEGRSVSAVMREILAKHAPRL